MLLGLMVGEKRDAVSKILQREICTRVYVVMIVKPIRKQLAHLSVVSVMVVVKNA